MEDCIKLLPIAILLVTSILVHSAVTLLVLIYLISKVLEKIDLAIIFKKNKIKSILIVIFLISIIDIVMLKISFLIKGINLKIGSQMYYYLINPIWGKFNIFSGSIGLIVYRITNVFLVIFILKILMKSKLFFKAKNNLKNFYMILNFIVLISLNYRTFSERYSLTTILIGILYIHRYYDRKNTKLLKIFTFLIVLKFVLFTIAYLGVWTDRYDYLKNKDVKYEIALKIFYLPGYELINIEKNGYSNEILKENLRKRLW